MIFLSPDLSGASKTTSGTMCTPFTPTPIQQQVWRHDRRQLSDKRHGKALILNKPFSENWISWMSYQGWFHTGFHPGDRNSHMETSLQFLLIWLKSLLSYMTYSQRPKTTWKIRVNNASSGTRIASQRFPLTIAVTYLHQLPSSTFPWQLICTIKVSRSQVQLPPPSSSL